MQKLAQLQQIFETIPLNLTPDSPIYLALISADLQPQIITDGLDIIHQALHSTHNLHRERRSTITAYHNFQTAYHHTRTTYIKARRRGQKSLQPNPEATSILQLRTIGHPDYSETITIITNFYHALLEHPQWAAAIFPYGGEPQDSIHAQLLALDQVIALRASYCLEDGQSQDATQTRLQAFEAATNWLSYFIELCYDLISDHIQTIEAFELTIYGPNYKKKSKDHLITILDFTFHRPQLIPDTQLFHIEILFTTEHSSLNPRWLQFLLQSWRFSSDHTDLYLPELLQISELTAYFHGTTAADIQTHHRATLIWAIQQANSAYQTWWQQNINHNQPSTKTLQNQAQAEAQFLQSIQ